MKQLILVRDRRFRQYEVVSAGYKELKTNKVRRKKFYNERLLPTEQTSRDLLISVRMKNEFAQACSQGWYFIFIFILITMVSTGHVSIQVVTSYALIALYMRNSLNHIVSTIPQWAQANIVMDNINDLNLISYPDDQPEHTGTDIQLAPVGQDDITLSGTDISFNYHAEDTENGFGIGPVNFNWRSGEIIFITGPNGSGKTTFLKVLVQLYKANSGSLNLNGKTIHQFNQDWYLNQLSITFADSYLFGDLLSVQNEAQVQKCNDFMQKLGLNDKVSVNDGKLSTLELSQGQRKRLSLLSAYLEDKHIYIFDEWADNQDPEFKKPFIAKCYRSCAHLENWLSR